MTPFLPSTAPMTVDLVLKAGDGPERTARMEADGDRYRLTAVPIPGRSGPLTLRLVAGSTKGPWRPRRPIGPSRPGAGR